MKQVEFTKGFATQKKGDKLKVHDLLASRLVNIRKVAKYVEDKKETKPKK